MKENNAANIVKGLFTQSEELFVWARVLNRLEIVSVIIKSYSPSRNEIRLVGNKQQLPLLITGSLKIHFFYEECEYQVNLKSIEGNSLVCSLPSYASSLASK